jgi:hypothetical protein
VAAAIQHAHYFLERACELAGFDPAEFMRAAVLELADVDGGGRR